MPYWEQEAPKVFDSHFDWEKLRTIEKKLVDCSYIMISSVPQIVLEQRVNKNIMSGSDKRRFNEWTKLDTHDI